MSGESWVALALLAIFIILFGRSVIRQNRRIAETNRKMAQHVKDQAEWREKNREAK